MSNEYGTLMIDISGTDLSDEDRFVIANKHVGGLILFSKNFESYEQIKNLVNQIKDIKENIIIAVDQEGGRVQRFRGEFTKIPSMQSLSDYARNENDLCIFNEVGWLISSELLSVGIDINFAPVLDIDKNTSSIIGDRAFSDSTEEVIKFTSYFIDGMKEAGMKSTGKHFPGHGGIYEDSHIEKSIDKRSLDTLLNSDIRPYIALKNKIDLIMCAHIIFPEIDKNIPSFSKIWIKDILKNTLQYNGLIISDDLSMSGAGNESSLTKAKKSLDAGCDMVIICNDRQAVINVLNFFDEIKIQTSSKISKVKKTSNIDWNELKNSSRAINIKKILNKIKCE
tara:strand:+ start:945 stop:1958 length:1014 start_codon:yes stop_codon:yes gene_type:complete